MKKIVIPLSLIIVVVSILNIESIFAQCNTWTQKADFGGTARRYAVGFSIGDKGYIGTGLDDSGNTLDFFEYDSNTDMWTQKANFGGNTRRIAIGFSIGNKGYIGTGEDGGVYKNDFWEYNPIDNTWTQKANFGGVTRQEAVGFSIEDKGYIGTGWDGSVWGDDFWEYNPLNNTWTQKANFGDGARAGAVGFSIGNKGYIGTGFNNAGTLKKDFWEYDPINDSWIQKTDFGGTARYGAIGFSIGNKGYIGTGYSPVKQDFWEYDPSSNIWTQKANFGGTARSYAVGFSIGNKGYIGTGIISGNIHQQDFWEYIPDLIADAGDNVIICAGDTVTIGGSPTASGIFSDYLYAWTPSTELNDPMVANPSTSPIITTTYIVTVTDSNGCISVDSVNVRLSFPISNISKTDVSCVSGLDGAADLTVSGGVIPYTFLWSNGDNTEDITNVQAGTYTIQISDACGVTIYDTVMIIELSAGPTTSSITGAINTGEFSLENYSVLYHMGSIYNWFIVGGFQTSGGQTNSISVQWNSVGEGQVFVVEIDNMGCSGDTVTLNVNIGSTNIQYNKLIHQNVNIYPNPNIGKLTLEMEIPKTQILQLSIINVLGQAIFSEKLTNARGKFIKRINLIDQPTGIYNLQILTDNNHIINKKIIIQ